MNRSSNIELSQNDIYNHVNEVAKNGTEEEKSKLQKTLQTCIKLLQKCPKVIEADFNKRLLNNDIWMKIISYLQTKEILTIFNLVCKHFHSLATDSHAIKILELKNINTIYQHQNVMKVLNRSTTIRKLTIENCDEYLNRIIKCGLKSNSMLKSLEVSNNLPYPRRMHLSATTFLNIRNLGIHLENVGFQKITYENSNFEVIANLKNLKSLKLTDQSFSFESGPTITQEFIKRLRQKSKNLESIKLLPKVYVLPDTMIEISKIQNLTTLFFRESTIDIITPTLILSLAKNCHKLENISFIFRRDRVSYTDLVLALNDFFNERKMTLKRLIISIPDDFQSTDTLKNLELCKNLEEFEGCNLSITMPLKKFASFHKLPKLEFLKLGNYFVEGYIYEMLFKHLNCPFVEKVILRLNGYLDDQMLKQLLQKCPNLRYICIDFKSFFTNLSYEYLFELCFKEDKLVFFTYEEKDSHTQSLVERYFQSKDLMVYQRYITMKEDFVRFKKNAWYN